MEKKGTIDRVDETACEREEEQKRREREAIAEMSGQDPEQHDAAGHEGEE